MWPCRNDWDHKYAICTYHSVDKLDGERRWLLDRKCTLKPASLEGLAVAKLGMRRKGQWAVTAAVSGVDTYLDLVRPYGGEESASGLGFMYVDLCLLLPRGAQPWCRGSARQPGWAAPPKRARGQGRAPPRHSPPLSPPRAAP